MNVIMCKPDFFEVKYVINPWMNIQKCPNSQKEWDNLVKAIKIAGGNIELIDPVPECPDMVFVDCGVIVRNFFIPSNFKYTERQGEQKYYIDYFTQKGYNIQKIKNNFEGHGDTLWVSDNLLLVGYGFRTSLRAVQELRKYITLIDSNIIVKGLKLVDPRFYHLDTCVCPLSSSSIMVYSAGLDESSYGWLSANFNIININCADALKFGCNSIVFGKNIVMPKVDEISNTLEKYGFNVHQVDVSSFIKAGGACKCMSFQY